MSAHYPNKYKQILLALVMIFSYSHAEFDWELDVSGDEEILTCTLQDNNTLNNLLNTGIQAAIDAASDAASDALSQKLSTHGICSAVNYGSTGFDIFSYFAEAWGINPYITKEFVGKNNVGNPFDLGGFAKCDVDFDWVQNSTLGKFCSGEVTPLSPAFILGVNSVDGEGLYAGGTDSSKSVIKAADREYISKLTGGQIYKEYDGVEGGYLLSKIKNDPYGSTAVALNTFDKASIVLKTLALKGVSAPDGEADNAESVQLPRTKSESLDLEDESVQYYTKLDPDLHEFTDILSQRLRRIYTDNSAEGIEIGSGDDMLTLAKYAEKEKEVTAKFFKDDTSGLSSIYTSIEEEAKAELASEMLLMTTDPNYIDDPSEARLAYIKDSQKNAFKYAALIQQEKNKKLKLRIARNMKHKKRLVDIAKQQAQIQGRVFRDDIARNELALLLAAVDEAIDYD